MRYLDDDLIVQCSLTPVSTRKLKRLLSCLSGPASGEGQEAMAEATEGEAASATAEAAEETVVHYKEEIL